MKKNMFLLAILILMLSLSLGCTVSMPETKTGTTIIDSVGREVVIKETPKKIVSISPAITEILFALGLDQEIIAVSNYCDYPEAALAKDKVGGFKDPNVELILSKDPDLVFASAGVQEELITKMEELNLPVVVLESATIQQVLDNIELAGEITDKNEKAKEIVDDMTQRMDEIITKVKDQPKPKVFFEVWDDPLMSAGSTSFIHNLIETAGGTNVAGETDEEFYTYSMEKLLETDPDIYIINAHSHTPEDIKTRNGYEVLSAVKNDQVFTVDDSLISRAGPRVIQGLEEMAQIIHPEVFKNN
ncbi:cobalamin-binding protein [Dehalobacterium formicoaceticum]|uniref:Cobalamin-binding protein n=1 Tax=Dehalobacterium formicoaceticum TaxID=51515 RepID=A0ABT1Y303_9FIRM|nr:cobalamin-binding protein [Dehalobacterium formicoaceticum]MCR6544076.1 cobalamin-binding protein [Dehalobacterium formicoaceticum]